ncbi:MAG: hypothetical protein L0271_20360 [Gemmatimonadetes bacterium]|nr:hypothetical protein [Gemmatimonadota bacterium]
MSPRRTILRELNRRMYAGEETYMRPAAIRGFDGNPSGYQEAVNTLLRDQLINGRKDDDGRLAIALNERRLPEVHRELRPIWARPVLWLALLAVSAGAVVVVTFF